MKICRAHVSAWLNTRCRQSLGEKDGGNEVQKLFKYVCLKTAFKGGRVWQSWMSGGMLF